MTIFLNAVSRILLCTSLLLSLFIFTPGQPALASVKDQVQGGVNDASGGSSDSTPGKTLDDTIAEVINILSSAVGIVAVIMIIVGGFRYITSGGNDASVTSAKNTILYAIIGLVVVALAQVIVRFTLSKLTNG